MPSRPRGAAGSPGPEHTTSPPSVTTSGSRIAQAPGRISPGRWRATAPMRSFSPGAATQVRALRCRRPGFPGLLPTSSAQRRQIISEISVLQRHSGVPPRLSLAMEGPTRRIGPEKQGDDECRDRGRRRNAGPADRSWPGCAPPSHPNLLPSAHMRPSRRAPPSTRPWRSANPRPPSSVRMAASTPEVRN